MRKTELACYIFIVVVALLSVWALCDRIKVAEIRGQRDEIKKDVAAQTKERDKLAGVVKTYEELQSWETRLSATQADLTNQVVVAEARQKMAMELEDKANGRAKEAEARKEKAENRKDELEEEIAVKQGLVEEHKAKLEDIKKSIAITDEGLVNKRSEKRNLEKEVENLKVQRDEKKKMLDEMNAKYEELYPVVTNLDVQAIQLQAKKRALNEEVKATQEILNGKKTEVENKKRELAELEAAEEKSKPAIISLMGKRDNLKEEVEDMQAKKAGAEKEKIEAEVAAEKAKKDYEAWQKKLAEIMARVRVYGIAAEDVEKLEKEKKALAEDVAKLEKGKGELEGQKAQLEKKVEELRQEAHKAMMGIRLDLNDLATNVVTTIKTKLETVNKEN